MNKQDSDLEKDLEYDKSNVFIVPTSHASKKSSNKVTSAINKVNPDVVAIELDHNRLQRFKNDNMNDDSVSLIKSFKKTKGIPIKSRLTFSIMNYIQSKIVSQTNVDILGLDMKTGYDEATKRDIPVALVDQDINETFRRFNSQISTIQFIKTFSLFIIGYLQLFILSIFGRNKTQSLNADDIDVNKSIELLDKYLPTLKRVLVDERNSHISKNIEGLSREYENIILVIGAAHEPGIVENLSQSEYVEIKNFNDIDKDEETIDEEEITDEYEVEEETI